MAHVRVARFVLVSSAVIGLSASASWSLPGTGQTSGGPSLAGAVAPGAPAAATSSPSAAPAGGTSGGGTSGGPSQPPADQPAAQSQPAAGSTSGSSGAPGGSGQTQGAANGGTGGHGHGADDHISGAPGPGANAGPSGPSHAATSPRSRAAVPHPEPAPPLEHFVVSGKDAPVNPVGEVGAAQAVASRDAFATPMQMQTAAATKRREQSGPSSQLPAAVVVGGMFITGLFAVGMRLRRSILGS